VVCIIFDFVVICIILDL